MFLDWSVNTCWLASALSFFSSFDLMGRNGPGCLHTAEKLPPGDLDGGLITSVSNQGDDFSSISAF